MNALCNGKTCMLTHILCFKNHAMSIYCRYRHRTIDTPYTTKKAYYCKILCPLQKKLAVYITTMKESYKLKYMQYHSIQQNNIENVLQIYL